MKLALVLLLIVTVIGLFLSGCRTTRIEDAFDGDYSLIKNNKMINEYCQSCHIHKDFVAEEHIKKVRPKYKMKIFRRATECRTCHYIEKKFYENDFSRKTRTPSQVNRGKYRNFSQSDPEPPDESDK
ncbi:MAG: hypothetical protein ACQ9MH_00190 [Nitrospinales bacterium]